MEGQPQQQPLIRSEPSTREKIKAVWPRVTTVRHVVSVECHIRPENAQHGARNVTNVEIKIISVHIVGQSKQSLGTGNPTAHPEDVRAKMSIIIQGLGVNQGSRRVPTA